MAVTSRHVTPLPQVSSLENIAAFNNSLPTGVASLSALSNLAYINLHGNIGIPCADIASLEVALEPGVVQPGYSCTP